MTGDNLMPDDRKCTSCGQLKAELKIRESRLWPGKMLLLCNRCADNKYEPRWLIVLLLKQGGSEVVSEYVKKHLYVGEKILTEEHI